MKKEKAVIIGAGPAGLTAAYEFLEKTDIIPVIIEMTGEIGGISKTVTYKGNKIDIGGHRFFSKSEKIMNWWLNILPLQTEPSKDDILLERKIDIDRSGAQTFDPEKTDKVMLLRNRLSRIYFLRKFFDYPISLSYKTFCNMGLIRVVKTGLSYIQIRLFPLKKEYSLADFFINRFGMELYQTFFKDYTEKVWGVSCDKIKADWGAQRVKGLSISKAILHSIKKMFSRKKLNKSEVETSLIDRFIYPKFGPGQLWEEVAQIIQNKGGQLYLKYRVVKINTSENKIVSVIAENDKTGKLETFEGEYFISTMPVKDLINSLTCQIPEEVDEISKGLMYRDFLTVGLLLDKLKIKNETKNRTINNIVPDNWIYIQERDVKVGRLQIFNNWSPYLVSDINKVWLGLEYFCNEGDKLWTMADNDLKEFAAAELDKIDIINKNDVLDSVVIRVPKAYPAYFGTYDRFDIIKKFTDNFENLYLIGRNGMHRYNNMDHSMLSAMTVIENVKNRVLSKENIWLVNTEEEYNEAK